MGKIDSESIFSLLFSGKRITRRAHTQAPVTCVCVRARARVCVYIYIYIVFACVVPYRQQGRGQKHFAVAGQVAVGHGRGARHATQSTAATAVTMTRSYMIWYIYIGI